MRLGLVGDQHEFIGRSITGKRAYKENASQYIISCWSEARSKPSQPRCRPGEIMMHKLLAGHLNDRASGEIGSGCLAECGPDLSKACSINRWWHPGPRPIKLHHITALNFGL